MLKWIQEDEADFKEREISMTLKPGAHVNWMTYARSNERKDTKTFHLEEGAQLDYFHHVLGTSEDRVTVNLREMKVGCFQTLFFGQDSKNKVFA